jgi:HK97 family phage prohead protease
MLHKSFEPLDTKVDAESGTFEAHVAIFNNVDKGGDRIKPGAFAKSLERWKASGDPIPVIFNHDWGTPDAHVGVVTDATETEKGLFVRGTLDVADNPVAKQVHRLMARRSLKEFSFGYSVPKGGEKRAKDGANDLLEIDLAEVGPTLKGMNPATELHAVKSALGIEEKPDLVKELQEVRSELAQIREELAAMKNAEEAGKETKSRPADPLKDDAMKAALEVLTGGVKPPEVVTTQEQPPGPDIDPEALKRSSRDLMLRVLTGIEVT